MIWITQLLLLYIPRSKPFQFLQFQANWTSKNAEFFGLKTPSPFQAPILMYHAHDMTLDVGRNFVTHKKDRWAKISSSWSLWREFQFVSEKLLLFFRMTKVEFKIEGEICLHQIALEPFLCKFHARNYYLDFGITFQK